ncbi:hypothetical protein CDL15_Pgr019727 [Punica granatum]|uniref:Uncharacterized protein n=1 Tax=Punica granatum TaxID=22663 RepID=A0A218X671_PUNGR|nr:hypothetical protein CDL15_Pgr019727 [Punica granatum]PKI59821.1 hypothetical protein CRG98_019769 [Punica granatum]
MDKNPSNGSNYLDHLNRPRTLIDAHSSCFLISTNGLGPNHHHKDFATATAPSAKLEVSDIEMISLQSATYTSLRDLIPSSPPAIMSPTNNSSWYEIPIRNPLVKQAALAYLQPMSTPPEVGDKGLLARLRERCGCLRWLRDVVLAALRDAFWGPPEEAEPEDDEEEEEEEEEDDDGKEG